MKKFTVAIAVVTGLIAPSAFAADMAVKGSPAPMPAPVYNWTGFYIGVNAGASMGKVTTDFNFAGTTTAINGISGTSESFGRSDEVSNGGFIGGGQIGYNWQFSPIWVVGLEADFQGALESDSSTLTDDFNHLGVTGRHRFTGTHFTDYTGKIDWFGTVRGRAGYVWGNGTVFSYLTGGLAYAKVELDGTSTESGSVCVNVASTCAGIPSTPFSLSNAFGPSHVNTGWVLGYGTEGAIDFWGAHNWTWRVETLYMDLGHLDTVGTVSTSIGGPPITALSGGQVTSNSHFTDWILRGGLNYRF